MDQQFKRILDLVRKTGDRLVVTDPEGQDAFVVMDLDQYESLIDLEEDYFTDDLPDYVSDDLDFLPEEEFMAEPEEEFSSDKIDMLPPEEPAASAPKDIWQAMPPAGSQTPTWDMEQMDDTQRIELSNQYKNFQENRQVKPNIEDSAQKPASDQEFGEDQFYLEPIE